MSSTSNSSQFDVSFEHGHDVAYPGKETMKTGKNKLVHFPTFSHTNDFYHMVEDCINDSTIPHVDDNSQKDVDANSIEEKTEGSCRVKELEAAREKFMGDLKRKLEGCLDNIRETTKHFMTEVGTYAQATHSVLHKYEQIFDSQESETQRLEDISQNVNNATNLPFLTPNKTAKSTAKLHDIDKTAK